MKRSLIPLFVLVLLVGCRGSKVHQELSFNLESGESYEGEVDAPKREQKVQFVLNSDQPVNIWILLVKDLPAKKEGIIDPTAMKTGVLASEKKTKGATLTATIPANEAYLIYVDGATKKTTGTVKVDSQ